MFKATLLKSQFKKNLFVLMTGMAIAQAIPIIFSPVLTRLFTPAEFGYFATFLAVSSFFTVIMSGKYELAIMLPKRDEEAINLLSLSALLSLVITITSSILLFFFAGPFTKLFGVTEIKSIVWLVPLFSFLATIYSLFNEWSIRKNNFLILSKNKISNTGGISGFSLLFGWNNMSFGLIFGQLFGQLFAAILAIYRVIKEDRGLFKFIYIGKIRFFAKRYIDFAKFNIPGQLINTIAGQLPIFFISTRFGAVEVGYYALTDRVLGVPLSFLGNSFRDVFKQQAATDFKKQGNCLALYKKTTFTLICLSIIPFIVLFIFAPELFSFVFGEKWLTSGEFTRALCLMYMLSFVSMPTSWIFVIAEKQKLDLLWQLMFLLFTVISLVIGYLLDNINYALWSFCIGRSITYLIQITMTYHLAKGVQSA
jgi:O-antigen/teichoic acid export membrane protein